jgi:hypothetical protein
MFILNIGAFPKGDEDEGKSEHRGDRGERAGIIRTQIGWRRLAGDWHPDPATQVRGSFGDPLGPASFDDNKI